MAYNDIGSYFSNRKHQGILTKIAGFSL